MKTRVCGPTTASALVPAKPVSQRQFAIASRPGVARADEVADDQLVEIALGNRSGEPVGALGAHAPSSRFRSSSASR